MVLCVDLDDDLSRKTGLSMPVVGRQRAEDVAVTLAITDPEDSNVDVLFQGIRVHDEPLESEDEEVEVVAVIGSEGSDVEANCTIGDKIDTVLASLSTGEPVYAIVIADGTQDESVLPIIRSRVPIDGVCRAVVRQAQNLESMYYTMKQMFTDPETRGIILVPLGILPPIYPFVIIANFFSVPSTVVLGPISVLLGLYTLFRGFGLEPVVDETVDRARNVLYVGRATTITYVAAAAFLAVGDVRGVEPLETVPESVAGGPPAGLVLATFVHGAVERFAAVGITNSLGQVTDEYLHDRFEWRYLNASFYVLAIVIVLYVLSGFFLPEGVVGVQTFYLPELVVASMVGTLLGMLSTLTFAVMELRYPIGSDGESE